MIDKKNNNVLIYATCSQKAQRLFKKIKDRKKKIILDNKISDILTHYQDINWADFCLKYLRVFAAKKLRLLNNLFKYIFKRKITYYMAQHISGKLNIFKTDVYL